MSVADRSQAGSTALVILVACAIVILVGLSGALALVRSNDTDKDNAYKETEISSEITDFQECAAAGNPVQESYPERCTTKDGKSFINTK